MFDKERFIQECIAAAPQGQGAIRELVARACAEGEGVMRSLGEPEHAGVFALHRSPALTVINFVWAPYMTLMPHNHQMWAVIGIYSGREDNVFWRREEPTIDPAGARSLGVGDVAALGRDTIHSVLNPIGKMTCAIHVYGGDFFAPEQPRSEWDHETLIEKPWDVERVKRLFTEAEERFNAVRR
jgi:predicted metal-dependent enzyme (double-stranded beta helix superfamily)